MDAKTLLELQEEEETFRKESVNNLNRLIDEGLNAILDGRVKNSTINELINMMDKAIKNKLLLTGQPTENIRTSHEQEPFKIIARPETADF